MALIGKILISAKISWKQLNIIFQWLHSPWRRSGGRSVRSWSRLCGWNCRRRGCTWNSTTAKTLRRHDPHSHFRRGLGSVRTYRGHLHDFQPLSYSSQPRPTPPLPIQPTPPPKCSASPGCPTSLPSLLHNSDWLKLKNLYSDNNIKFYNDYELHM